MSLNKPFIDPPHFSLTRLAVSLVAVVVLSACSKPENKSATVAPTESANSVSCGKVNIANMNWQSAEVLANIDKIILEKGYGCQVELVPGDSVPTTTSMTEKGQPDIAPELWLGSVKEPIEKAVKEGRLHIAGASLKDGSTQGWWIPQYVADAHPEIKTIDDALKRPDLFPLAENKSRGVIYGCPSGWACQVSTAQAYKAWDAKAKGFDLKDPGSAAGLDGTIAKAYQRQQPWLGYYWAPTSILGKYKMVKLDAGVPFDQVEWDRCNSKAGCPDPKKNDWTQSEVVTVVTDHFKKNGGDANTYLAKRTWGNDTVNQLLAWMSDNQATGEDGARYFLKNHIDVWSEWVSPAVAAKIKGSI